MNLSSAHACEESFLCAWAEATVRSLSATLIVKPRPYLYLCGLHDQSIKRPDSDRNSAWLTHAEKDLKRGFIDRFLCGLL